MNPSFDLVDWIIGLTLLGGASVGLLIALLLVRKWVAAFAAPIAVFVIGLTACLAIDFALQQADVEAFFRAGTHKRHAMRGFLPWSLGLIAGLLSVGGWAKYRHLRWKARLQVESPEIFAALYASGAKTPNPSIERTSSGKPAAASHVKR